MRCWSSEKGKGLASGQYEGAGRKTATVEVAPSHDPSRVELKRILGVYDALSFRHNSRHRLFYTVNATMLLPYKKHTYTSSTLVQNG